MRLRVTCFILLATFVAIPQTSGGSSHTALGQTNQAKKEETAKWDDYTPVFRDISAGLTALRSTVGNNPEALQLLDDIGSRNAILKGEWDKASNEAWEQIWGAPPSSADWGAKTNERRWEALTATPKAFLVSLQNNLLLLQSIINQQLKHEVMLPLLKDVAEDMRIKAGHCTHNGWASLVTVTVVTKKNVEKVEGYEVAYVPSGWASDPRQWLDFPKLSTALKDLPPGLYMMRIKGCEPKRVEIDGNGANKQEVELKVP
jgi:hypothetical protein